MKIYSVNNTFANKSFNASYNANKPNTTNSVAIKPQKYPSAEESRKEEKILRNSLLGSFAAVVILAFATHWKLLGDAIDSIATLVLSIL